MKIKNILRKRNESLKYEAMSAVATAATGAADLLCAPPAIKNAKRVLCVQPHPDDNQIGMGGTIAYMRSLGIEVYELTVTDDRFAEPQYIGKENEVAPVTEKKVWTNFIR